MNQWSGASSSHAEHELLLRHFAGWAEQKGREVDVDLLGALIGLRASYDDLEPTYWPEGSVEHLLVDRWPSKGPVDVPASHDLEQTLDAWFRFLRSTGRMSGRSADVKELLREVRRSAPRMAAVADDRASWSSGKTLLEFGRSIGIDIDELSDVETLQGRLDEISRRWNELPDDERRALMPDPSGATGDLTLKERLLDRFDLDDPIEALVLSFQAQLPGGTLPTPAGVAPAVRESAYLRRLLALREWIGDGRELTSRDLLRPEPAHAAYDVLNLDDWVRDQVLRRYPDERLPGVAAAGHRAWIDGEVDRRRRWRSAGDCPALHRLWFGAHAAGLVEFAGRKVVASPLPDLADDEAAVGAWLAGVHGLVEFLDDGRPALAVIVQALMSSYVTHRGPVAKAGLVDFYQRWIFPPSYSPSAEASAQFHEPYVEFAIGEVADTGILEESGESVRLTPAGDIFVSWWLRSMGGSAGPYG